MRLRLLSAPGALRQIFSDQRPMCDRLGELGWQVKVDKGLDLASNHVVKMASGNVKSCHGH